MVTRLYEGDKNETGGTGIEVTENKVINLILRSLNNLIKVNDNNEVYVDLQLEDGIENSDTLPIGVNVGRVLQADGRPATGTLISGQTTSGDRVKILYGDNGNIYLDNGTGVWRMLGVNTMTFYLTDTQDNITGQAILDRYLAGKNPIIIYNDTTYLFNGIGSSSGLSLLKFNKVKLHSNNNQGDTSFFEDAIQIVYSGTTLDSIQTWANNLYQEIPNYLATGVNYAIPYTPQFDGSPATKKYVDDKLILDSTAPSNPAAGQLWYDTTNSKLNIYDGTQRVQI